MFLKSAWTAGGCGFLLMTWLPRGVRPSPQPWVRCRSRWWRASGTTGGYTWAVVKAWMEGEWGGVWNWWSAVYLDLFGLGKFGGCIMWYVMICYVCDGLAQFLVVRSTVVTWNETNDSLWVSTGGSVFYLLGLPGRRKGATRQLLCTNLLISNQLTEI